MTAILFFAVCMLLAGALLAFHRYRTLKNPVAGKPRGSSL
jgi:hypothetical protein